MRMLSMSLSLNLENRNVHKNTTKWQNDYVIQSNSFYINSIFSQWLLITSTTILIGIDANVSENATTRRKLAFANLTQTLNLETVLPGNSPTFHHNNGSSTSQIDHILTNDTKLISFLGQKCKLDDSDNLSGHDALLASIKDVNVDNHEN